MLLYPHPHEYFSCGVLRMIIQVRLPQVWSVCGDECDVCSERLHVFGMFIWMCVVSVLFLGVDRRVVFSGAIGHLFFDIFREVILDCTCLVSFGEEPSSMILAFPPLVCDPFVLCVSF